jgi:hypothetical protein
MNNRYVLEMKLELTQKNGYGTFIGYETRWGDKVYLKQGTSAGLYIGYSWYYQTIADSIVGYPMVYRKDFNKMYINGKCVGQGPELDFEIKDELLFGSGRGKIYYFKIWDDNGVLVRDYIPVLDKEGKVCMYEKVMKEYVYYNGTGLSYE